MSCRVRRFAAVAFGTGGLALIGSGAWPFTVDDAFIVARYAERIMEGRGYTMNDGPPTDGVTSPLWLAMVLLGEIVRAPIVFSKGGGLVCTMLAAAWVIRQLQKRQRGTRGALASAAVLGLSPTLGIWSVGGLETGLACLIATAMAMSMARRPRSTSLLAFAAGLVPWVRPDLAIFAAVLLTGALVREGRRALNLVLVAGLLGASSIAFRLAMFGDGLPLSAAAKPGNLEFGLGYASFGLVATTGLVGAGFVALAARTGRSEDRWLGMAVASHLLATALAGGDWMPGYRLLAPIIPIYAYLVGVAASQLSTGRAAFVVGLTLVAPALDLTAQLPAVREAGALRETIAAPLAEQLSTESTVALVDVGFLAYAGGFEVIDLAGITDPEVGRLPGAYLAKPIDAGYLVARDPSAIVVHSDTPPHIDEAGRLLHFSGYPVERHIASLPWVQQHFRVREVTRYHAAYYYIWLERHRSYRKASKSLSVTPATEILKAPMSDHEALDRVREVLESMLPADLAANAMQEVLGEQREPPNSTEEVLQVVDGPLRDTLTGRVPDAIRDELLGRLHGVLAPDGLGINVDVDIELDLDYESDEEPQATERILYSGPRAVPVVAVAASRSLELRLIDELRQGIVCRTVHSVPDLRKAAFADAPLLVLIDGADPAHCDLGELATAIRGLPNGVVAVIWAAEQRFGARLVQALDTSNGRVVSLDRREGWEPLLDLITSRRSTPSI